jgi:hypothetical protein
MKHKILFLFTLAFIISTHVWAQDTAKEKSTLPDQTYPINAATNDNNAPRHQIYRDTRLGSSSPYYNTYEKNDYGAGAITTNPHKSGGTTFFPETSPDTNAAHTSRIYRDTRLGSSSSSYDTYQKNDDGAGAVTTNPHK